MQKLVSTHIISILRGLRKSNQMKHCCVSILFLLFTIPGNVSAQVKADVIVKSYSDLQTPYIDVYTFILQNAIQADSIGQKSVESLLVISDENAIIVAEKFLFNLTAQDTSDVIDLKKYKLENGNYTLRIELLDLVAEQILYDHTESIVIQYTENKFKQSDLFLSLYSADGNALFEKHGVCLEPIPFDYCKDNNQLSAYSELYNLPSITEEDISVGLFLYEGGKGMERKLIKKIYKRFSSDAYLPILMHMDISDIPTGNYDIIMEAATKDKTIVSFKEDNVNIDNPKGDRKLLETYNKEFENSFVQKLSLDELNYNLRAIFPRVSYKRTDILNSVIQDKDIKRKRYFLFRFWTEQAPDNSEALFYQYKTIAEAVDRTFNSNVGRGFETDRGYIFLRYGKPSDILAIEDEPTAPPYEIWRYNRIEETGQNNVKFLFYNPSLASNDFSLLHSTCRGEKQNPRWELELYKDDPNANGGGGPDVRTATDGFNRNARRFFEEF